MKKPKPEAKKTTTEEKENKQTSGTFPSRWFWKSPNERQIQFNLHVFTFTSEE
jgi:hypothetical protein